MQIDAKPKIKALSQVETAFFFIISYFMFVPSVYAVPNVADMIENIAKTVPQLMYFTTALAYVFGFWFVFHGLLLLKKYGMQRTQMSGDANLAPPLLSIFVGAALIYLPTTVQSGMSTFWTDPNPYGYETANAEWNTFIGACFMIIQLVGVIAFMRGLMMLTKLGQGGGQQAGFGRAAAHIVGGIFCIDMYDFLKAVFETLGLPDLPVF
jgi:intracellular multiplication protein IcmC